jgi:hypothetical protein
MTIGHKLYTNGTQYCTPIEQKLHELYESHKLNDSHKLYNSHKLDNLTKNTKTVQIVPKYENGTSCRKDFLAQ